VLKDIYMPDEALITEIENVFAEIIDLGGQNEDSKIVPNLTVQDASPTNLDGWLIVSDDRDGDNILARKVGSVVYADNDLVNVMFLKGGEAIAFQQGSESGNNGIWEIVPSTSTDIFYDKGDVGIGKSIAPDAALEVLDTSQSQLRLTHTEDTKFADLTLDTNHDLTITPSSTGQIILQPTTDSVDFFQVLDAGGGNPVINVDSTNEVFSVNTATSQYVVQGSTITPSIYVEGVDGPTNRNFALSRSSDAAGRGPLYEFLRARIGGAALQNGDVVGRLDASGHDGTDYNNVGILRWTVDGSVSANTVPTSFQILTSQTNSSGLGVRLHITSAGLTGVGGGSAGVTSPLAQVHIDQASTTAAIPTLYLDQADVSEEMIEFNTTIGVGNAIEAVGAKTLTTTHFIKVTLPGALTRYIPVGTIA
jgi:hypothetical protein